MSVCGIPFTIKNILCHVYLHEENSDIVNMNGTMDDAVQDQTNDRLNTAIGCLMVLFRTSSILFHGFYLLYRIMLIACPTFALNVFTWTTNIFSIPGRSYICENNLNMMVKFAV